MSRPEFTRAQRRRMQKLADRIGLISEADRKYFERFPQRRQPNMSACLHQPSKSSDLTAAARSTRRPAPRSWSTALKI